MAVELASAVADGCHRGRHEVDVGRGRWGYIVAVCTAAVVLSAITAGRAAVTYFGLTFPDRIAGATLGSVTDFEKNKPGLGYGLKYQLSGWAISIFIYDDAIKTIPDDLSSDVLKQQLAQAHGDIAEMQKRGTYSEVKLTGSHVIKDARGQARFLCEDFDLVRQNGENVDSFLCFTGWHNKFVKFRLSTLHRAGSDGEAKRFMDAWIGVLWP